MGINQVPVGVAVSVTVLVFVGKTIGVNVLFIVTLGVTVGVFVFINGAIGTDGDEKCLLQA